MRRLTQIFGVLAFCMVVLAAGTMRVNAATCQDPTDPLACACNTGSAGDSAACTTNGSDPITGSSGVLQKASLIIATIAGIAAVIVIIVSGLQYITSNGDAQRAAGARTAIIGAAVGLVIIAAAEGIIRFVVSRL